MIWRPFDRALKVNPYPHYDEQRKLASVFQSPSNIVFCLDYKSVKSILKNDDVFRSSLPTKNVKYSSPATDRILEHCLLVNEGDKHAKNKRMMIENFSLDGVEEQTKNYSRALIDSLKDNQSFDLVRECILPISKKIVLDVLGFNQDDGAQLYKWSSQLLNNVDIFVDSRTMTEMEEASEALEAYISQLIYSDSSHGFVGNIIKRAQGCPSFHDPLRTTVSFTSTLLFTGINTTVGLIGNVMIALLSRPGLWKELHELNSTSGELSHSLLEELLRFCPSVHFTFRFANVDTSINGIEVRKDQAVAVCLASANRDENVFEHPNKLLFDRQPNPHLTFGVGKHYCFGAKLARIQLRIVLSALLKAFPLLSIHKKKISYMKYNFMQAPASIMTETS